MNKSQNVLTPEFRVSYPALKYPIVFEDGNAIEIEGREDPRWKNAKYIVSMLFEKGTDLSALEAAFEEARKEGVERGLFSANIKITSPFRNGSEKEDKPEYKEVIFSIAKSGTKSRKPISFDMDLQVMEDPKEGMYAGCYAKALVNAFPYNKMGNKGVSFGLQDIHKVREGERFDGRDNPLDHFEPVEAPEGYEDNAMFK